MGYWADRLKGVQPQAQVPPSPYTHQQVPVVVQPQAPQQVVQQGPWIQAQPAANPNIQHRTIEPFVAVREHGQDGRCPSCGGSLYDPKETRVEEGYVRKSQARCLSCNWPLVQFSSDSGDGGGMMKVGGVTPGAGLKGRQIHDTEAHLRTWDPRQGGAGRITAPGQQS